ncbi:MAG TPA: serine/threonine-protein kinase [Thermoguttaceae bacterium]|nr:serine/threonine-protein kinase [Thermoguttaceae bacterium]
MSQASHDHPPRKQLEAFASGTLQDDQIAEVEKHLGACETCLRALETLPEHRMVLLLRKAAGELPGEAAQTAIPEALRDHPRYRVVRRLGSGGMGVVFLAEQVHLKRRVALKVIRPDLLGDPKAVERFRSEVRAAGRLSHPNIVTTYDADRAGESWFLVSEWVDGTPLNEVVAERGPLPVPLACQYAQQAALGLEHAFERGLIHRDVKPHNLLLTPEGTIKVLDFGLARFVAEWDPAGSLTDFGTGLGTPDYVAPEQARNARAADVRADVYSLGCTLYFLLAGQVPFPQGSASEKIAGHLERVPESLSELRSDLPPELGRIVERMMAKDPDERFQTPAEVARALEPFFAAGQSPGEGQATAVSPGKHPGRAWLFLAGLAVAVAVVGLLLAVAFWAMPPRQGPLTGRANRSARAGDDGSSQAGTRQIAVLEAHSDRVRSVAMSPGGRYLASGGRDGKVQLWQLPGYREAGVFVHHSPVNFVGFSPGGDRLLFGGGYSVVVADPKAGRVVRDLYVARQEFTAAVFLPGRPHLRSADLEGVVREWDVEAVQPVGEFRTTPLTFVAFSPDGRYLLFSSGGLKVQFCDVRAEKTLVALEGHAGPVRCVALSSKADRALTGSDDHSVRLWDLATGRQLHRLTGHEGPVRSVAFSPDDARALSGGDDGTLRLWDLTRGSQLARIDGHEGGVWSVAFSPDGKVAASGGADGTVRVWELRQEG